MNLRQLEERLNMIQEECNRLSEESDDELSATIDDRSERNYMEDADALDCRNNNDESGDDGDDCSDGEDLHHLHHDHQHHDHHNHHNHHGQPDTSSVFGKIDQLLDRANLVRKGTVRSRSEGWTFSDCESDSPRTQDRLLETYTSRTKAFLSSPKASLPTRGRPRSAPARTGAPLHRAHSCGSLRTRSQAQQSVGFWDLLSEKSAPITILSQRDMKGREGVKGGELTLTLTSVSAPLSLLHLQSGTSRCCNLC